MDGSDIGGKVDTKSDARNNSKDINDEDDEKAQLAADAASPPSKPK